MFGLIEVTQAFLPLLHKSPSGRIVNVSSLLGSLTLHSDPASPIYDFKVPAYNVSKSAVNAWTVQLAYELKDSTVKVNTIHPGYVKTDMNAGEGEIEVADGAKTSVALGIDRRSRAERFLSLSRQRTSMVKQSAFARTGTSCAQGARQWRRS